MDSIWKKRKQQLQDFRRYLNKDNKVKKQEVPDGLYQACLNCNNTIRTLDLKNHLQVCPQCGHHLFIDAYARLDALFDSGKYKEYYTSMKSGNPLGFPGYEEKLEKYEYKTGLHDGVVVAGGRIDHMRTIVVVMDHRFMMASMGSVAGEKITRAIEMATRKKLPLIIFTSSGGARMQEGIFSLMQMGKTCAALKRHLDAGLLYISYLTHPTTGGVTASFAMLGDINIAEPEALVGFAGPRVIESTMNTKLPDGFQRAEFLEDHGFIDMIVEREKMRDTLALLLRMHA